MRIESFKAGKGFRLLEFLALALLLNAVPLAAQEVHPRIISLYAAHTEVLLRLGAKDNIIGVSAQETYSGPEAEGWNPPVFTIHDDVEKFLAAKPDLVLVRPMHMAAGSRLVSSLKTAGIKVHSEQVLKAGDLYKYWRNLAALVGRQAEVEKMIINFDQQISIYHEAAQRRPEEAKPTIFLEAIHNQVKTFTPDSLPVWLVELAGGRNVAADAKAHAKGLMVTDYGPERLLAKAKEIDIFISQAGPMNNSTLKQIKSREIYKPIRAFKDGRVYKIPEELLSRPTPSLIKGLEELAALTGLDAEIASGQRLEQNESEPAAAGENQRSANVDEEIKANLPPEN